MALLKMGSHELDEAISDLGLELTDVKAKQLITQISFFGTELGNEADATVKALKLLKLKVKGFLRRV